MLYVSDVMTTALFTLTPEDTLQDARALMQQARIRHIPIIDSDGYLSGLLTHRDLLNASLSRFADIDASEQNQIDAGIPLHAIMHTKLITVEPNTILRQAAVLLLEHKIGCVPVVEKNKLVGIITEADFLKMTIRLLDAVTHI